MTTPKLTHVLLALFAGFAITGVVLLVFARDTGATGAPESCGPQQLTITETTASVDADCEVDLVVYAYAPDATESCIPGTEACIWLPQHRTGQTTGTGPLSLELPCGGWQADVVPEAIDLPAVLDQAWMDANGPAAFSLLAGDHGYRECTPEVNEPTVIKRPTPAVASAAAVPVVAEPRTAG